MERGYRKMHLQIVVLKIFMGCRAKGIELFVEWTPRDNPLLVLADLGSKTLVHSHWMSTASQSFWTSSPSVSMWTAVQNCGTGKKKFISPSCRILSQLDRTFSLKFFFLTSPTTFSRRTALLWLHYFTSVTSRLMESMCQCGQQVPFGFLSSVMAVTWKSGQWSGCSSGQEWCQIST